MKLTQEEFENGCSAIEENLKLEVQRRTKLTDTVNELVEALRGLYKSLDERNKELNDYVTNLKKVAFTQTVASNDVFPGIRTVNIQANISDMEKTTSDMKAEITKINSASNIISKQEADSLNALKDLSIHLKAYEDIVSEIYDSQMDLLDQLDSVYDIRKNIT